MNGGGRYEATYTACVTPLTWAGVLRADSVRKRTVVEHRETDLLLTESDPPALCGIPNLRGSGTQCESGRFRWHCQLLARENGSTKAQLTTPRLMNHPNAGTRMRKSFLLT